MDRYKVLIKITQSLEIDAAAFDRETLRHTVLQMIDAGMFDLKTEDVCVEILEVIPIQK